MSIFEYDEEKHMKSERKEWREIGYREGLAYGHEKGLAEGLKISNDTLQILQTLMDAGKTEEVKRALSDSAYREQLYREYLSDSE